LDIAALDFKHAPQ